MAAEEQGGEPLAPGALSPGAPSPAAESVLTLCDRLLDEVGRRRHRFSWLTAPNGDWLPVDAYYPGNRLVVMLDSGRVDHDQLLAAHHLRLLRVAPTELSEDPGGLLARMVAALELPARPVEATDPAEQPLGAVARAFSQVMAAAPAPAVHRPLPPAQAAAAQRAQRFVAKRPLRPEMLPRRDRLGPEDAFGLLVGLAIGAAVVILVAVIVLALLT